MSLKALFVSCLSLVSLAAARPVNPRIIKELRRSLDQPQGQAVGRDPVVPLDRRDDIKRYDELQATITISEEETPLMDSGGYPRLAQLRDGTILAAAFRGTGEEGETALDVTKSTDGGKSFNSWGEITKSTNDIGNTFLLEIPNGEVLAAIRNHTRVDGNYTDYRITLYKSCNGGKDWSFVTDVVELKADPDKLNGVWEPAMRVLSRDRIELTYSGELAKDNQETFLTTSDDGGRTWAAPRNLRLHGDDERWRDGMQNIVPVKDASRGDAVIVVLESLQDGHFKIDYAVSYDDGATWGHRGTAYEPRPGFNAGSPQIANIGDDIAIIFGTDEDQEVSPAEWTDGSSIKMVFSKGLDNGTMSWTEDAMTLSKATAKWPYVLQTEQDAVMAVYGRDNKPWAKTVRRSTNYST
ncbi:Sialidase [Biscogniauxia mediterranea]|nr:Sialidase [Biscogniauxia mediterranea]